VVKSDNVMNKFQEKDCKKRMNVWYCIDLGRVLAQLFVHTRSRRLATNIP
jgi:hypothetical protein